MFDLKNKVIIVVGGRGYLGRDFCYYLNKQNGIVISADLKKKSTAASKSKNKTLTSYSSSKVKKSKKEIKLENLKKKTKNIKNITCEELEMLDNVNSDDGVDLESEVE